MWGSTRVGFSDTDWSRNGSTRVPEPAGYPLIRRLLRGLDALLSPRAGMPAFFLRPPGTPLAPVPLTRCRLRAWGEGTGPLVFDSGPLHQTESEFTRAKPARVAGVAFDQSSTFSAASMASLSPGSSGSVLGSNRAAIRPSRSTMNFSKFQVMSPGNGDSLPVSHW